MAGQWDKLNNMFTPEQMAEARKQNERDERKAPPKAPQKPASGLQSRHDFSGSDYQGGRRNSNYSGQGARGGYGQPSRPAPRTGYQVKRTEPEAKPLPDNYVDCAQVVMKECVRSITTSKLRRLMTLVMDIYNEENLRANEDKLKGESVIALQLARVRMLYEAGRDDSVGGFLESSNLIAYLRDIGDDRKKLIMFTHYMEALVAYHKFYGGKE